MSETDYGVEAFMKDATAIPVAVTPEQCEQLRVYAEVLASWNEKMNLTAIVQAQEVWIKHFLDSLHVVAVVREIQASTLIDVGTGAGFPGLVVKIVAPDVQVTLVDSLRKRVDFLQHVVARLGLTGIAVVHGRAEDLARDVKHRDRYAMATARAVAKMSTLAEWCLPFVGVGGLFVAMKGPQPQDEVNEARAAMRALSGSLDGVVPYSLPHEAGARSMVMIRKTAPTSRRFPRKPGDALRNPLT